MPKSNGNDDVEPNNHLGFFSDNFNKTLMWNAWKQLLQKYLMT